MRDSFVFYRSFEIAVEKLHISQRAKVRKALVDYALDGVQTHLTGGASAVFELAKPQIDANNKRYHQSSKGGIAKRDNMLAREKIVPNVNENVNENGNERGFGCRPFVKEMMRGAGMKIHGK